jgi:hypothetical protein
MESAKQLISGSRTLQKILAEENEMAIIVKAGGDFTPAPEGLWPGVCVDVVDKGIVASAVYKPRHMIQIRWVINAEPPLADGRPHMAVRSFGATLGEKSALRPFLEAWRGKKFTEEELAGFDIENLLGANGQIQVIHNRSNGKVYGNVQAVVPFPRGMEKMTVPTDYIRQAERDRRAEFEKDPDGHAGGTFSDDPDYPAEDEDIPF